MCIYIFTYYRGSGPKKIEILTFSQIHPATFGLCLGIITDTCHVVFEFEKQKNIFFH